MVADVPAATIFAAKRDETSPTTRGTIRNNLALEFRLASAHAIERPESGWLSSCNPDEAELGHDVLTVEFGAADGRHRNLAMQHQPHGEPCAEYR